MSKRQIQCSVDGCSNFAFARGYCRRHYGQIWRRGMIYDTAPQRRKAENGAKNDDYERLRALERELQRAKEIYDAVVGYQNRIKWRKEVDAVLAEIRKIREEEEFCEVELLAIKAETT